MEGEIVEGGLFCRVGFDNLAKGGDPKLCIILQVKPEQEYGTNRRLRVQLIGMLKDILTKRIGWVGWNLDNLQKYSGIKKNCSLKELLPSEEIEEE